MIEHKEKDRMAHHRNTWRVRTRALACAALIGAGLLGACSKEAPGGAAAAGDTLLLSNFTLIDGTGAAAKPGQAMLVEDGRIKWVGPVAEAPHPDGVQPVDLAGKFVMPGLIDLHVHLGTVQDLTQKADFFTADSVRKDLRTYASYGVTTVQSMGTDGDAIFGVRDAERAGRPDMARVYTAGQGIVFKGGYGGVPGINHPVATPAEAKAEVDAQVAKNVDFIKLWVDDELHSMPKMPAEISKAVIDEAHAKGKRALAHVFYLDDAKRLVEQGIDGFVHSVRDKPIDDALIAAMKAKGTWQVAPTLSREAAVHAFGAPNPITKDPFFRQSVSPASVTGLESPEREKTVSSNPNWKFLPEFDERAKANFATEVKAGIPYGFGTDAGPPGRVPGYSEHWELWEMVKAGLTPLQAITAATGNAAKWLNADTGTLQPGKWADLVVLNADPLADIHNSKTIDTVYIAGNKVPSVKP
ncbi:amidohydrolase family protein [Sphingomonas quercus]|uniref:Amidohydrolase family protein n=1 Tax=Sphingomonas quercus TaxID=2842451 RepID=A0ABS6BJX8_9SPHN|nr:amidohydrolase family protein [Sphingomonas quercus]MBU3078593.1 amidohydrolase family protein [Sphingomonas quercus]